MSEVGRKANIALIGAGWWSQGWHLPSLDSNEKVNLVAIVDKSEHPQSNLNPDLNPLATLKELYQAKTYTDTKVMMEDVGSELDGILVATPHATHFEVCRQVMTEIDRRKKESNSKEEPPRQLHILMEKPMTTDISHAIDLYKLVKSAEGYSKFWINHSANFREQTKMARKVISSGQLGPIRHITAFFASPLKWIFEDPALKGWNEPTDGMIGNGFAWGQSSHLFAYLYHICPHLEPTEVYCVMTHSATTGADISHSATIRCKDTQHEQPQDVVMSVSGTTLLPGNAHSHPPIAKMIQIEVYGNDRSLHYSGNDREPSSGRLEIRHTDGKIEVLLDEFLFENLDNEGNGPESLQNFVNLCCGNDGNDDIYEGANVMDGLRSIQTIDAMYKSDKSRQPEKIIQPKN